MATPTTTVTIVIHGPMVESDDLPETVVQRTHVHLFGGVPADRVGYPGALRRIRESWFGESAGWNIYPPAIDNSGSRYPNRMQVYARDMDHFAELCAALPSAHAALHNVDATQPVG